MRHMCFAGGDLRHVEEAQIQSRALSLEQGIYISQMKIFGMQVECMWETISLKLLTTTCVRPAFRRTISVARKCFTVPQFSNQRFLTQFQTMFKQFQSLAGTQTSPKDILTIVGHYKYSMTFFKKEITPSIIAKRQVTIFTSIINIISLAIT
ncbi:hypothetical protein HAX54_012021 [Datura stramonium]|uniref:Uncharacterized protein n=1 Tax=Datura stramonium TaxID=4076 RepID=A0ABS8Y326_DATST|nr:hypothetical protein [Datura stramonium]